MRIKLNIEQIEQLPIHDAIFKLFELLQNETGDMSVIIDMEIKDDSYDPGYSCPLGVNRLFFEKCRLLKTDFNGVSVNPDTFFDIKVIKESSLLMTLKERFLLLSLAVQHYQLTLNSGSTVDILAEAVFLTQPVAEKNRQ